MIVGAIIYTPLAAMLWWSTFQMSSFFAGTLAFGTSVYSAYLIYRAWQERKL